MPVVKWSGISKASAVLVPVITRDLRVIGQYFLEMITAVDSDLHCTVSLTINDLTTLYDSGTNLKESYHYHKVNRQRRTKY